MQKQKGRSRDRLSICRARPRRQSWATELLRPVALAPSPLIPRLVAAPRLTRAPIFGAIGEAGALGFSLGAAIIHRPMGPPVRLFIIHGLERGALGGLACVPSAPLRS